MDSRRGGNDDVEADVSDHNSVASTKSAPVVDRYDHPEIATTRTVDANARAGVVVSVDRRGEDTGARASPGAGARELGSESTPGGAAAPAAATGAGGMEGGGLPAASSSSGGFLVGTF